jgi:peptide/nickel transport system permease protein
MSAPEPGLATPAVPAGPTASTGLRLSRRPWFLRGITGFVLRRVLLGVLTLFVVSIIVFASTQILPGDAARSVLGRGATPEAIEKLRATLELDKPVVAQYTSWLGGVIRVDFGNSLVNQAPVASVIGPKLVNSLFLMGLAALIGVPLALLLGVISARRRDSRTDHVTSIATIVMAALPEFVVGLGLVTLLGTTVFTIFPPVSLIPPGEKPWDYSAEMVLPTLALVITIIPYIARTMRGSMIDVLESDYVEMARLKGVPERTVMWRHALPGALPPTIQVIALSLAWVAGGIVLVEYVFAYPGIGSELVAAVSFRDVPVVQALAMIIAGIYVVMNILADVVTVLVSPRLRTSLR